MTFHIALILLLAAPAPRPLPAGRTYTAPVRAPRAPKAFATAAHFNTAGLTCQVHHSPLRAVDVPIGSGHSFLIASGETVEHDLAAAVRFPNVPVPNNSGSCMQAPDDPVSAVQLVCDQCILAERQWSIDRERSRRVTPSPSRR